jgi:hypothetical protein
MNPLINARLAAARTETTKLTRRAKGRFMSLVCFVAYSCGDC